MLREPVPADRVSGAGRTPLQEAAESNRVAVVEFLIACGADLQGGEHRDWWSPLQLAAYHGHREVADRLLAAGAPLDLYSAVALDKRDAVERCLRAAAAFGRAGWVANARYAEYTWTDTPLVCVAYARGHAEMVDLLVRHGADPRAEVIHRPCYISDNRFEGVSAGVTPAGELIPR